MNTTQGKQTIKEYLYEWVENHGKANLLPSTFTSYKSHINNHILTYVGHVQLNQLTPARAVGMIMLGFGVVQIGLSLKSHALKSHDPSQRANGFLTLAGGVVITFAKEILTLITG
ncbi:glutamyl-tRNA amidotransferase [Eubacteriales bacterium OttesenSCG-928-G02]|nr:glutamyl-tRNA amidotransferase [Eubacteriales bacterium OttesenSCG-928-G02]